MIESIEKPQESIRKNRNPHRVIPAQAGIQKHNAAGLYRKKPKPHRPSFPQKRESKNATQQESIGKNRNPTDRHSRKSGNPKTQRNRNPSEKTETPPTVIPAKAGIQQHNAAGIYRKKQKPPPTVIPAKAGIQQPKNHRNLSAKTETPTAVIPAKAGIQTRRHGNLPNKTVSLDSTSQIPAFAGMTRF
ncbi:hypothetical protein [Neisseria meningitidis]|uniref:hypothetical protein n=1 Tax=Neisseria meningitidis TaxID=487 RepID=UPI000FCC4D67|nr:hypothetical protein [Neisseria meningitidis]